MKPGKKKPFAKKSLGQNFLADQNYIDKIIRTVNPTAAETIIEIGAGRGALTERLVESGAQVLAIELDRDLIPDLMQKFGGFANFQLIEQDALTIDFQTLLAKNPKSKIPNPKSTRLVANLPYYISTAILQKLIEQRKVFGEMILMFQREVVERITAPVNTKDRGFLTVLVEACLHTEKLFDVPPQAFRPAPKVQSAVVRLRPREPHQESIENEVLFRRVVSLGFAQKRKTIQNNLKKADEELILLIEKKGGVNRVLELSGIEPNRRAESLTLENWRSLCNLLDEENPKDQPSRPKP